MCAQDDDFKFCFFFSNEKFWRVNLDKNQKKKRKHISAQRKILIFFCAFFFYINSLLLCIIITKAVGNLLWEIWNTKHQLLNPILFFRLHSPQNQLDFLFHWYFYHSGNKSFSRSKTIIFHRVCLEECVSRYNVGRGRVVFRGAAGGRDFSERYKSLNSAINYGVDTMIKFKPRIFLYCLDSRDSNSIDFDEWLLLSFPSRVEFGFNKFHSESADLVWKLD